MDLEVIILITEAVAVYCLVLAAHSLRHRFGLAHYYALIGGVTAVMSWVTDAGIQVQVSGVTFVVGSTVFYTALLLSVFVVYVFDGPRATRVAISTIIGVSIMVPVIAVVLNLQAKLTGGSPLGYVPTPSLRINAASVFATAMDLMFLAISWEFMNNRAHCLHLGIRAFLTLLGVMWLDVLLFSTGAFAGSGEWLTILEGTAVSRLVVACVAAPILWAYLRWQNKRYHAEVEQRPVLAILREFAELKLELSLAQQEIERRKKAERELQVVQDELKRQATTDPLTGLANRRYFFERAATELARSARFDHPMSLIAIDLDHFKSINDRLGHAAGDLALMELAKMGRAKLRQIDLLARVGGEEFYVLLSETDLMQGQVLAERMRRAVEGMAIPWQGETIKITASLGVAEFSVGMSDLDDLMKTADQALYEAKRQGRNRVVAAGAGRGF